jgi:hypothetical protein
MILISSIGPDRDIEPPQAPTIPTRYQETNKMIERINLATSTSTLEPCILRFLLMHRHYLLNLVAA